MMLRIGCAALGLMLMVATGCDRYVDSRDPVRSVPEDGPVPTNIKVFVNDGSVRLTWEIDDPSQVLRYRIYVARANEPDTVYELRDSSTTTTATIDGLTLNKRYLFQVAAVTTEGWEWERSQPEEAVVTFLSVSLNDGDMYAPVREVDVNVTGPLTVSHIMLSEDSTFAGDTFRNISGLTTTFELSEGDGTKFVYAKLQFTDGSGTGDILSDSIILDTKAEIDSVFFQPPSNGKFFQAGDLITFGMITGETGGRQATAVITGKAITLFDDGTHGDPDSGNGIYYGSWRVPAQFYLNEGVVTGQFIDRAGITADPLQAQQTINIYTAPEPVILTATALSNFEIMLNWTQSTVSPGSFAGYKVYRDLTPNVTESSRLVESITSQGITSYTDTTLNPETTYYYRLFVCNSSAQCASSEVASARTLVNEPPDAVELLIIENNDSTLAQIEWGLSNAEDFESYRLYQDTTSNVALNSKPIKVERSRISTTHIFLLPFVPRHIIGGEEVGTYRYYRVYVFDRQGLQSQGSNVDSLRLPVDTTLPPIVEEVGQTLKFEKGIQ